MIAAWESGLVLVVALVAGRLIDDMGGDDDQSCPRCDDLEAELQRIIAEGRQS